MGGCTHGSAVYHKGGAAPRKGAHFSSSGSVGLFSARAAVGEEGQDRSEGRSQMMLRNGRTRVRR